jgi:RNA polymerase sigma-70 factor, ECF subfamily
MNPSSGPRPYPSTAANDAAAEPRNIAPAADPRATDVDLRLIRGIQAGDETALGEFYDRWFPVVNCLVSRMLKTADDTEDVVEETFWQAWRQAQRYSADRGTVQTWLLTIARSRALDRLRARRRLREDSLDDDEGFDVTALTDQRIDPSLAAEHAERKRLVVAALAELPKDQREALELGYFGGLSQTEIAERTGQPLGTVKTRMRLAMLKLRERLSVLREAQP